MSSVETWITAYLHDANDFSGDIRIPIVPNLFPDWVYRKVETRCSQGKCIVLAGKHEGHTVDITFVSQQDAQNKANQLYQQRMDQYEKCSPWNEYYTAQRKLKAYEDTPAWDKLLFGVKPKVPVKPRYDPPFPCGSPPPGPVPAEKPYLWVRWRKE